MSTNERTCVLELRLDEHGNPLPIALPTDASLMARSEIVRDVTQDDRVMDRAAVSIYANRSGLRWLAYKCLALSQEKEEPDGGFHYHVIDRGPDPNHLAVTIYLSS